MELSSVLNQPSFWKYFSPIFGSLYPHFQQFYAPGIYKRDTPAYIWREKDFYEYQTSIIYSESLFKTPFGTFSCISNMRTPLKWIFQKCVGPQFSQLIPIVT